MFKQSALTALALLLLAGAASAQTFSGTYVMTSQNLTLTLVLRQDAQGTLSGTLSSTTGAQFQVDGMVQNGVGVGTCMNNQGGSYFEAHPEGDRLLFALIEPGQNNMPDYNKVRKLLFVRQGGAPGGLGGGTPPGGQGPFGGGGASPGQGGGPFGVGAVPQPPAYGAQQPGSPQQPGYGPPQPGFPPQPGLGFPQQGSAQQQPGFSEQSPGPFGAGGAAPLSVDEVSDPGWAFTLTLPKGWKYQKADRSALLGHDTIPGLILVLPHEVANLQALQSEMQRGIREETMQLIPAGRLQQAGNNALAGDYAGMAQGNQVKARGIGVLSPGGGGAYIIAIATPQAFGAALTSAAESVAQSLKPAMTDASDLVRHFAGTWATMTKSTQTLIALYPNGTFARRYEAGYSGQSSNSLGHNTGNWGLARDEHAQGRWTVRGTKQQGILVLTDRDGSRATVRYQVHVEKGQVYWSEYFFDGDLFAKQ